MTEWKLAHRRAACATCERAFEAGEPHVSSLALDGESLVREERCLSCWRALAAPALFWWRTRQRTEKRRGLGLDLEALEALFVRLQGRVEPALSELRYVLCLILLRKRRLTIERVVRDSERESLVVRRRRQRDTFDVGVFDFTPEAVERMSARLHEIFDGAEAADLAAPAGAERDEPDPEPAPSPAP